MYFQWGIKVTPGDQKYPGSQSYPILWYKLHQLEKEEFIVGIHFPTLIPHIL